MTLTDVISKTIGLVNIAMPVLFTLALVLFMWTAVRYITHAGEGNAEVRGQLACGLVALFVIFSIWGLVNVFCFTFLNSSCGH